MLPDFTKIQTPHSNPRLASWGMFSFFGADSKITASKHQSVMKELAFLPSIETSCRFENVPSRASSMYAAMYDSHQLFDIKYSSYTTYMYLTQVLGGTAWVGAVGAPSLEGKFQMLVFKSLDGLCLYALYVCTIQYSTGQYMISCITSFWRCNLLV